jgi:cell division septal protein FtsQ
MKRIQELLRNASIARRVFTFISLILLVSIGIVWFVVFP